MQDQPAMNTVFILQSARFNPLPNDKFEDPSKLKALNFADDNFTVTQMV